MASVTFRVILNETVRDDNTQLVLLRITYQRKHKYVGTGVYFREKQFNPEGTYDKANWVRKSYGDPDQVDNLNGIIKTWLNKGDVVKRKLSELNQPYTVNDVKQQLEQVSADSLAGFIRESIALHYARDKGGTARNHYYMLRDFLRFMGLDQETGDFTLYQITPDVIERWETHMLTRPKRRASTTDASRRNTVSEVMRQFHGHIKRFIIKHKLPDQVDPMRGRIFEKAPGRRVQLSDAELQIWASTPMPTDTRGQITKLNVRNLYLCSYYLHGLRAGDLIGARVSQLQADWHMSESGPVRQYRFYTTAQKTDKSKTIFVEPEILPILLSYAEGKQPDDFLFPFLKPVCRHYEGQKLLDAIRSRTIYIDSVLKKVAADFGIKKRVSMHTARHTFADMLYEETKDVVLLQHSLFHADLETTSRYLSGFKQSVADRANNLYRKQAISKARQEQNATETLLKHLPETGENERFAG